MWGTIERLISDTLKIIESTVYRPEKQEGLPLDPPYRSMEQSGVLHERKL